MIEYLEIYDATRTRIGILDSFTSIIWKTEYVGAGMFEIYAPATDTNRSLLQIGNYVTKNGNDLPAIIESIETSFTPIDGRMLIVTGRMAKIILNRRIAYKATLRDPDAPDKGYTIAGFNLYGDVESACRTVVNDNIIASADTPRNISFLKLGNRPNTGLYIVDDNGNRAYKQVTYKPVLDFVDGFLDEYDLGSQLRLGNDKNLYFDIIKGFDRSVGNTEGNDPIVFSQQFDNLLSSVYRYESQSYKNCGLCVGEGEGIARKAGFVGAENAGIDRFEEYIDASSISQAYNDAEGNEAAMSDADYLTALKTFGKQTMKGMTVVESLIGATDLTNSRLTFGALGDYNVGDKVTFQDNDLNLFSNVRIVAVTEIQDAGGYNIDVDFGGGNE